MPSLISLPKSERSSVYAVCAILSVRMLGLFLIFPVFSLYGQSMQDASPFAIALAIGSYSLAQGILQVPYGILCDKLKNPKLLLYIGLTLFTAGGVVCFFAESLHTVILGRIIQGSGAISGIVMASVALNTSPENRTKAMAWIGMIIGITFIVSVIVAPLIALFGGLKAIFLVMVLTGLVSLFLVHQSESFSATSNDELFSSKEAIKALKDKKLLGLMCGVFCLHFALTAGFVHIPQTLGKLLDADYHFAFYGIITIIAAFGMFAGVIRTEKTLSFKRTLIASTILLIAAQLCFLKANLSLVYFSLVFLVFLSAFMVQEALLPSLVSRVSKSYAKNTVMSTYTSLQFLGAFLGSATVGILQKQEGIPYLLPAIVVTLAWVVALKLLPSFKA